MDKVVQNKFLLSCIFECSILASFCPLIWAVEAHHATELSSPNLAGTLLLHPVICAKNLTEHQASPLLSLPSLSLSFELSRKSE